MKAKDVEQMSEDQLQDKLFELRKEQFNLRFQAASGNIENTARVRQVRRGVARIKTAQNQRASQTAAK